MTHPNLSHWDAAPVHGHQRDLARAACAWRAGATLGDLPAGHVAAPQSVRAEEEELVYLLCGAGVALQGDAAYAVGAGDCLLARAGEPAHTLVAGEDGLTYLAFAPRPLPRDVIAALPPAAGAAQRQRPPTIIALEDVPPTEVHRGRVREKLRRIGDALGSDSSGMRHVRIAPGGTASPHHCHGAEEEVFVVLGGSGQARLGEDHLDVARGAVLARPPGTGIAHSFIAGDQGLELLGWGTREPNDICFYPDSGKVFLCGVGVIGRLEPADYWDGEE